jgi:hypothetical protein
MRLKILILALVISHIANAQQQIDIRAKIISYKEPFNKMKVDVISGFNTGINIFTVTEHSIFLNSNGKEISLRQFKEGTEYNFRINKNNNVIEVISVSSGNSELATPSEDIPNNNDKSKEKSFYTGNASTSLGLGIGSTLKPMASIDKSKLGKALIWENRINQLDLGKLGFLSAGGYFGIKTYKDVLDKKTDEYLNTYTYLSFGARASFHLQDYKPIKRWDPYLGFMYSLNMRFSNTPTTSKDRFLSNNISGFLGSRFYVIKNLAFFIEAGFGINYINFGLTFNRGLLSKRN